MRLIYPYLKLGAIDFLEVTDIPCPIAIAETYFYKKSTTKDGKQTKKVLITCVAINPIMSQIIAKVAMIMDCYFVEENDSMRAMALLLDCKPDLIFLDLGLPDLSSYELCTELRKLNYFKKTPIVLIGRNIGLIERMKAKMSGASELLEQSMDIQSLLDLVQKYIKLSPQ